MWARRPDTLGLRASCRTRQLQFRGPAVPGVLTRRRHPGPADPAWGRWPDDRGTSTPRTPRPSRSPRPPAGAGSRRHSPARRGRPAQRATGQRWGCRGCRCRSPRPGGSCGEVGALARRIKGVDQHLHAGQAAVCDEAEGVGVQIPRSSAIRARPGTERRAFTSSMPGPGSQWPPLASAAPSGMHQ